MKTSPNFSDVNRIIEWHGEGKSPSEISKLVKIKVEGVEVALRSRGYLDLLPEVTEEAKDGNRNKTRRKQA